MKRQLEQFLMKWPSIIISDTDIASFFEESSSKVRNDLIQRAVFWGWLHRIKRGLYLIRPPFRSDRPSLFEIAQHIHGPSYISMESALSYYQMIPEAVYATVSVCPGRSRELETSLGLFLFHHIPLYHFYEGVETVQNNQGVFLIASPLKALGDYVYTKKKNYSSTLDLQEDLRIETESLIQQPIDLLKRLEENYPNQRVRKFYKLLHKELFA